MTVSSTGIYLDYPNKEPEQAVLAGPVASLEELETFGFGKGAWRNRLIHGDNLPILRALSHDPEVAGKTRLVYIDPPFGTGQEFNDSKEEVAYMDSLMGAEFLEFLRKRLILLRNVLADDGSIYVHIDWKMGHYVKLVMDEVFGPERFINDIARVKCNPKNFERPAYGNIKDMILFYSKTEDYIWNGSQEEMDEEAIKRLFPKMDEDGRRYTTHPLHAPGETKKGPTGEPWKDLLPPKGRHWRYPPVELDKLDQIGLIEWSSTGNPRKKFYEDEIRRNGKKRQDIWWFKDPPYPVYPTEKNLEMLKIMIQTSSNENDLVLDAFCGSGTTLVAAEQLHRRWIGIDSSNMAIEIAKKQVKEMIAPFELYKAEY